MEYKKKIIIRVVVFSFVFAAGVILAIIGFIRDKGNGQLYSYGTTTAILGLLETFRYIRIMRNEEKLRAYEIRENDERVILIDRQTGALTIDIFSVTALITAIVLTIMNFDYEAKIILYALCGLVVINMICRKIVRRKY